MQSRLKIGLGHGLRALMGALLLCFAATARADFQGSTHMMPFDEEPINYGKKTATGTISRLQEAIDKGEISLKHDARFGYLPSLLEALKIPASSQMLVFSKTSFQRDRISPKQPRALFFSDEVYIGFIPGAPLLEVSMADPKLGGVFYTLDQKPTGKPRFARNDNCLECHASPKTMGVPGHVLRSFMTDDKGYIDQQSAAAEINHRTPLSERWGGWYVTGQHGAQTHRGNLVGPEAFLKQEKTPNYMGNLGKLDSFFDTSEYLQPGSDIVALMVLEHQTHMHNFITRLNYEATSSLQMYGHIKYLRTQIESFLKYLLFTEETPLTAEVKGTSGFARDFTTLGPCDKRGRSLRDFDLRTRLFKYPCSFLIYSPSFDQLPDPMRWRIYERLWEILSGKDTSAEFAGRPAETKRSILEILRETKPGLPDYWKSPPPNDRASN